MHVRAGYHKGERGYSAHLLRRMFVRRSSRSIAAAPMESLEPVCWRTESLSAGRVFLAPPLTQTMEHIVRGKSERAGRRSPQPKAQFFVLPLVVGSVNGRDGANGAERDAGCATSLRYVASLNGPRCPPRILPSYSPLRSHSVFGW
jgi:hypothetical protein